MERSDLRTEWYERNMPALREGKLDIEECDRQIKLEWKKMRHDPKADPDQCRVQIDIWLDARLQLMRKAKAKSK